MLHLKVKIFHSHKLTFIQLQIASESGLAEHGLVGSGKEDQTGEVVEEWSSYW